MNEFSTSYTQDPLISVIMPCYNSAEHLESSIQSIQAQTYPNFELIVVDDGSSDNSKDILLGMSDADERILVFSQKNKGAGPARNRGLEEAKGEYVAFLDSDDYWSDTFLINMLDGLVAGNAELAYCGWQNIGLSGIGRGEPFIPPDYSKTNKVESLLGGCRWPIHGALTKKSAIDAVGRFDESLTSCMDYDLWLKIATRFEIILVPAVMAFYRHHGGVQITKNKVRLAKNHWLAQVNYLKANPDVVKQLGKKRIRELTVGELLHRGYVSYWNRDLEAARTIFRIVMRQGYGNLKDWKYMLPSLLPLMIHEKMMNIFEKK